VKSFELSKKQTKILLELLKGKRKMTELQKIIKNYPSLQKEIMILEAAGLVERKEEFERQRVVYVSLTEKGKAIAQQMRRAEKIAKMSEEELKKFRGLHYLEHFNVYEDHITLTDSSIEGVRYVNIFAKPKGDILYFWCDVHEATDCYHIGYLFVDEKLRSFINEQLEKNGFKLAPIYKKYVDKYW